MQATRKGSWLHGWSCQTADMSWMLWTKAQGWEMEVRLQAAHVCARHQRQSADQQPVCKCVAAGIGGQVFPMTRLHAPFARSVVSEAPRLAVHVPAWQADASWSVGTAGRNGACMHVHAHKRCTTCQGNRKVPQAGGCRRWHRRAQNAHIIASYRYLVRGCNGNPCC